ncbi:MAG: hypothetical protein QXK97_03430 [Acidilobaceae archaeon]
MFYRKMVSATLILLVMLSALVLPGLEPAVAGEVHDNRVRAGVEVYLPIFERKLAGIYSEVSFKYNQTSGAIEESKVESWEWEARHCDCKTSIKRSSSRGDGREFPINVEVEWEIVIKIIKIRFWHIMVGITREFSGYNSITCMIVESESVVCDVRVYERGSGRIVGETVIERVPFAAEYIGRLRVVG